MILGARRFGGLALLFALSLLPAAALAGYGVAFALTGVLYAPLLVVQQVAAARLLEAGDIGPTPASEVALSPY